MHVIIELVQRWGDNLPVLMAFWWLDRRVAHVEGVAEMMLELLHSVTGKGKPSHATHAQGE